MLLGIEPFEICLMLIAGLLLDRVFGEPRRWHPLVGFGRVAVSIEGVLNRQPAKPASRLTGAVAVVIAVAPFVVLTDWLASRNVWLGWSARARVTTTRASKRSAVRNLWRRFMIRKLRNQRMPRSA